METCGSVGGSPTSGRRPNPRHRFSSPLPLHVHVHIRTHMHFGVGSAQPFESDSDTPPSLSMKRHVYHHNVLITSKNTNKNVTSCNIHSTFKFSCPQNISYGSAFTDTGHTQGPLPARSWDTQLSFIQDSSFIVSLCGIATNSDVI